MERQDGGGAPEGRAMGEQPLARMMRERGLANHDLVAASARPITHKLVMRAARGRRPVRPEASRSRQWCRKNTSGWAPPP